MPERIDRYAVFGDPVAHSKSPFIHTLFAEQTGEKIEYTAQHVDSGHFRDAVAAFAETGGKGLNITVPHKEAAWALCQRRSPRAERAGAVNTLVLNGVDDYFGDNTDGIGLARDVVRNLGWTLGGRRILVLGAGGAVRGVLEPLLSHEPVLLLVANRTPARAVNLAEAFADLGSVRGCGLDGIEGVFDVIINGTSASLSGEMPGLPEGVIDSSSCCYDMMYAKEPTPFMRWARRQGCGRIVDGIGMLVEQAAESFRIWRGKEPDTARVIEALKRQ